MGHLYHGYVSHNQMVCEEKEHLGTPKFRLGTEVIDDDQAMASEPLWNLGLPSHSA